MNPGYHIRNLLRLSRRRRSGSRSSENQARGLIESSVDRRSTLCLMCPGLNGAILNVAGASCLAFLYEAAVCKSAVSASSTTCAFLCELGQVSLQACFFC